MPLHLRGFFLVILICLFNKLAFAQHWQWVKSPEKSGSVFGLNIAADERGNSYVTGRFSGTVTFGAFPLTSSGVWNAFIAKYDPKGQVVWARKVGNPYVGMGHSIALDPEGNIYITGVTIQVKSDFQYGSVFLAKYNAAGNLIWIRNSTGIPNTLCSGSNSGSDVVADKEGNSYVSGRFSETITLGDFTLTGKCSNSFIAKYDSAGEVLWAKGYRDLNGISDIQNGLALDAQGNTYVTGAFEDTTTIGTFTLTGAGYLDIYLAKFDPDGNTQWVRQIKSPMNDNATGIAIDLQGNCYIIGGTDSKTLRVGSFNLTNASGRDRGFTFIAKYDGAGEVKWVGQVSYAGLDEEHTTFHYGFDLALDQENSMYVIGNFGSSGIPHGQVTLGDITLDGKQNYNLFVAKFDSTGKAMWAKQGGGFGGDIAIDSKGYGYVTGYFETPVTFDDFSFTAQDNNFRMFVGRFASSLNSGSFEEKVYIPNIITPNGDGLNETFSPYIPVAEVGLKVFNRWGKQVYQQSNYQNTWNGDNLPAGTYYYLVTSGTGDTWKGWFEISR